MYLWDIDGLKDELINRTLAESTKFAYLFVYVLAMTFYMFEPGLAVEEATSNANQFWANIIFTIIVIGGTVVAYISNGAEMGKSFADRYFSLGLLSLIRVLAISMPIFVIIAAIPMEQGTKMNSLILLGVVTSVIQYGYLAMNMLEVANADPEE
jgi:cbb3-type cytochrome oxidase subunit 3